MQFVGVAWFGSDSSFEGFIDEHGLTFPQVSDDAGDVYARFDVPAQPALVIIDSSGAQQQFFGAVDSDELDSLISAALG